MAGPKTSVPDEVDVDEASSWVARLAVIALWLGKKGVMEPFVPFFATRPSPDSHCSPLRPLHLSAV